MAAQAAGPAHLRLRLCLRLHRRLRHRPAFHHFARLESHRLHLLRPLRDLCCGATDAQRHGDGPHPHPYPSPNPSPNPNPSPSPNPNP
eukprot:scaffold12361_cov50-Phaeocystis_antarctica.AAC.1